MHPFLRNTLVLVGGIIAGSAVNMGIISISGSIIPPPEGADVTTMEGLVAAMHLFEAKHFLMPFLAHALGTLVGAFLVAKLSAGHHLKLAIGIGIFFFIGGCINVYLLPSPLWFNIVDLTLAYFPMAFLGWKIAR